MATTSIARPETGPNKRPRLSAPTTEQERLIANPQAGPSSRPHMRSPNGLRDEMSRPRISSDLRRSQVAAIQAALDGDPSDDLATSGTLPPGTARRSTVLQRHHSSEDVRQARLRAIHERLREKSSLGGGEMEDESCRDVTLRHPLAASTQRAASGVWEGDDTIEEPLQDEDDYYEDPAIIEHDPVTGGAFDTAPPLAFMTFSANGSRTVLKPPDEETVRRRLAVQSQWEQEEAQELLLRQDAGPADHSSFRDTTSSHLLATNADAKGKGPLAPQTPRVPLSEVKNRSIHTPRLAATNPVPNGNYRPSIPVSAPSSTIINNAVALPQTPARGRDTPKPFTTPSIINPAVRALNRQKPAAGSTTPKKFVSPFKSTPQATSSTPGSASTKRVVHYGTPKSMSAAKGAPASQHSTSRALLHVPQQPAIPESVMRNRVFNLEDVPPRKNMLIYGVDPEAYSKTCLMTEFKLSRDLFMITPFNAANYSFRWQYGSRGCVDAYDELLRRGCGSVTQEWVENHWSLILWKLAGLVRALPNELRVRWSWDEVIRQLLYRYEREWNRGHRSAVKKIQEQDAPASLSMVLTVCDITFHEQPKPDEPGKKENWPEFVLTDGWYKIRATSDECLTKAVHLAKIRVGTKIAMSGIRLDAAKEAKDALKALDDSQLKLTGNSTSLARWHAKLGFVRQPFIPTIASLSADGGNVPLLCVLITKLFPIGFMDAWVEGQPRPIPRCQKEEDAAQDEWEKNWEKERDQAVREFEDRLYALEGLAERLDRASNYKRVSRDLLPDWVDGVLEELEEAPDQKPLIAKYNAPNLAYLAAGARAKLDYERKNMEKTIEADMANRFPPRQVRAFRVACIEDVRTCRRTPMRTGQLTIWDVMSMGDETVREGEAYCVTSLVPTQKGSWRRPDVESEVFLQTTRGSRWRKL